MTISTGSCASTLSAGNSGHGFGGRRLATLDKPHLTVTYYMRRGNVDVLVKPQKIIPFVRDGGGRGRGVQKHKKKEEALFKTQTAYTLSDFFFYIIYILPGCEAQHLPLECSPPCNIRQNRSFMGGEWRGKRDRHGRKGMKTGYSLLPHPPISQYL